MQEMLIAQTRATALPADAPVAEDVELVRRARQDRAAFAQLYERHATRLFRYLCARVGSVDEAADLTQMVFTRALVAIDRGQIQEAPFAAWLFRTARTAATDAERRRRRGHVPLDDTVGIAGSESDPVERAISSDELRRSRSRLDLLPSSERELLALRFAGGLTSRDIARLVGKTEEAVKKQLWRILRKLREDDHVRAD